MLCVIYDSPMSVKLYDEDAKWWYLDNETLYEEIERERKIQTESLSDKEQQFIVLITKCNFANGCKWYLFKLESGILFN